MREGLINVPEFDNDGNTLWNLTESLMTALADRFGGVTAVQAQGLWISNGKAYREPITQLIVAYEPSEENDTALRNLAVGTGRAAKQLAMYVRFASGEVEIIDTSAEAKAA